MNPLFRKKIRQYRFFLAVFFLNMGLFFFDVSFGMRTLKLSGLNFLEMLGIVPPIFIMLGLLDVWVDRETMMKWMGEGSGTRGVLLAFLLGAAAAGPLYAAFPVAGVLLKKEVKLTNVLIFIGAWSTTKIPMLLFEASSLGTRFTLIRLCVNLGAILVIAFLIEKALSQNEKKSIYMAAQEGV